MSPEARDISGRIVYASGKDVILYGEQLLTAGSRMIRKHGGWPQEELAAAIPPLLGISSAL